MFILIKISILKLTHRKIFWKNLKQEEQQLNWEREIKKIPGKISSVSENCVYIIN